VKKEYAVKVDSVVLTRIIFKSKKDAQAEIKNMEEADRVYDNPMPPRRQVVSREVSAWKVVK
jgi:hypothetical protein